jgi:hypothetical protein
VSVARPVQVGAVKLRPIGVHEISGAALNDLVSSYGAEVIVDVRPLG